MNWKSRKLAIPFSGTPKVTNPMSHPHDKDPQPSQNDFPPQSDLG